MGKRKGITGASAASIAVAATLAGAPAAEAQVEVIGPGPIVIGPGPGGGWEVQPAFHKLAALGFPGSSGYAFSKSLDFHKLAEEPGSTDGVFHKLK
jgi:hypothetical protein